MTCQDFINKWNGQNGVGDTPENDGQCVGIVEVWLDTIGSPHIWGNACDLPNNADRNAYVVTPNSPTYVPKPGDIGCMPAGWEGSGPGHTFLVDEGTDVNTLRIFEQNDRIGGGDGRCRRYSLSYTLGLSKQQIAAGWPMFIHPKVLDRASNQQGGDNLDRSTVDEAYRGILMRSGDPSGLDTYTGKPAKVVIETLLYSDERKTVQARWDSIPGLEKQVSDLNDRNAASQKTISSQAQQILSLQNQLEAAKAQGAQDTQLLDDGSSWLKRIIKRLFG